MPTSCVMSFWGTTGSKIGKVAFVVEHASKGGKGGAGRSLVTHPLIL